MIIAPFTHLYFRQIAPSRAIAEGRQPEIQRARKGLISSKTRETIVESFRGGQYIVGLSYITVGFINMLKPLTITFALSMHWRLST
jgi:hypothetical protein